MVKSADWAELFTGSRCEISIMVVHDLPKVRARVRFPYLALQTTSWV